MNRIDAMLVSGAIVVAITATVLYLVPYVAGPAADVGPGSPYVASSGSEVYHRADCRLGAKILAHNRVYFRTSRAAADSGRRPCRQCLTQWSAATSTKGKVGL